jgi:hypothetical protein
MGLKAKYGQVSFQLISQSHFRFELANHSHFCRTAKLGTFRFDKQCFARR